MMAPDMRDTREPDELHEPCGTRDLHDTCDLPDPRDLHDTCDMPDPRNLHDTCDMPELREPEAAGGTTDPALGILYESSEWSDFKLAAELAARGCTVRLVDMERPDAVDAALRCDLLVSRVFASALARGHARSHQHMAAVITQAKRHGIELINPGRAHAFEISKQESTRALADAGLAVPRVLACSAPEALEPERFDYPCVIKPDCGGRSARTAVLHDAHEAREFIAHAPADTTFIVEDHIAARAGYLTRIEIVGGHVAHINKRSIAADGLSSYHAGSTYAPYPDCPAAVRAAAETAAKVLSFELGSFDVIEAAEGVPVFIDANSVSNVSEDCNDLLGFDLMAEHAAHIAERWHARRAHTGHYATHGVTQAQPNQGADI